MSENHTNSSKGPPKPSSKITTTPAGGNAKPEKPPASNGAGRPPKGWDFVETPDLDKEDIESSKDKQ